GGCGGRPDTEDAPERGFEQPYPHRGHEPAVRAAEKGKKLMRRKPPEFTSRLSRGETIAALAYLPVHILLLPLALTLAAPYLGLGEADLNLALYAVGTVYMLLLLLRFLRRDFDPLLDRPGYCVVE